MTMTSTTFHLDTPQPADPIGPLTSAVSAAYQRLAPIYDLIFGPALAHGRRRAVQRLDPRAGERILEVGVGTGLSACDYPTTCHVAAIDLSEPMLTRACSRLARRRLEHVGLCRMDAGTLGFADRRFDAVYAAHVLSVVPDPVGMLREMLRVCRPGGRLVLLNHFVPADTQQGNKDGTFAWRLLAGTGLVTRRLRLEPLLDAVGLGADLIETVNLGTASVVLCRVPHRAQARRSPRYARIHSST